MSPVVARRWAWMAWLDAWCARRRAEREHRA